MKLCQSYPALPYCIKLFLITYRSTFYAVITANFLIYYFTSTIIVLIHIACKSGTSLLRSPTGLDESDLNGEVTVLQGVLCTVEYNLGMSKGDRNEEVTLLVR